MVAHHNPNPTWHGRVTAQGALPWQSAGCTAACDVMDTVDIQWHVVLRTPVPESLRDVAPRGVLWGSATAISSGAVVRSSITIMRRGGPLPCML